MPTRDDVRRARDDVGTFARVVGWPLTPVQAGALSMPTRISTIVAPRQSGKSRTLAVLACWSAFRRPAQHALIISAGEEAASRLLAEVRRIVAHPLLTGSVVDEGASRVVLGNGSTIRSVPASERQIRGWSVDLLICDEAAFLTEDLLLSAALPTTAARPDARIVLASSPWSDSGPFHAFARQGDAGSPSVRTVRWSLADCEWITAPVIEAARASMSEARFRAEFLAEFVSARDLYFDPADLRAAVAAFAPAARLPGCTVGLDWGRSYDAHAIVVACQLVDYRRNAEPVVLVASAESSRRPYADQVSHVAELARRVGAGRVVSETNGVGAYPSEDVAARLRNSRSYVERAATSQRSKEDSFGRVRALLTAGRLVLPDDPQLLRELGSLIGAPTPMGGLTIRAAAESIHDDIADAASLAISRVALSPYARGGREPDDLEWTSTGSGIELPNPAGCGSGRVKPVVLPRLRTTGERQSMSPGAASVQAQVAAADAAARGRWSR